MRRLCRPAFRCISRFTGGSGRRNLRDPAIPNLDKAGVVAANGLVRVARIQEQSGNKEFAEMATNTAMIRNTHLIQRTLFLDVSLLRVDQRAPFLIER